MEKFLLPERNGAAVWKGESGHGNVCQDGAADGVRYQHGGGSLGFERRRAENTVQAQQREVDGLSGSVSGSLQFEAILKMGAALKFPARMMGSSPCWLPTSRRVSNRY